MQFVFWGVGFCGRGTGCSLRRRWSAGRHPGSHYHSYQLTPSPTSSSTFSSLSRPSLHWLIVKTFRDPAVDTPWLQVTPTNYHQTPKRQKLFIATLWTPFQHTLCWQALAQQEVPCSILVSRRWSSLLSLVCDLHPWSPSLLPPSPPTPPPPSSSFAPMGTHHHHNCHPHHLQDKKIPNASHHMYKKQIRERKLSMSPPPSASSFSTTSVTKCQVFFDNHIREWMFRLFLRPPPSPSSWVLTASY